MRRAARLRRGAASELAAAEPGGRERINVSPSGGQPRLNPQLTQAYALLQGGNLDEARAMYTSLRRPSRSTSTRCSASPTSPRRKTATTTR